MAKGDWQRRLMRPLAGKRIQGYHETGCKPEDATPSHMKPSHWRGLQKLKDLLQETKPSSEEMAMRLQTVEHDVILPVKAVLVLILAYYLYFSSWFEDVPLPQSVGQQIIERFFLIYLIFNIAVATILLSSKKLLTSFVQRMIFTANFVDGLFLAALTYATGGFDSILYWLFLGLIVRNAVSCPRAAQQLVLNFSTCFCYLAAGGIEAVTTGWAKDFEDYGGIPENPAEPFLLRLCLLLLMTVCCYGVQVLFEKQRRATDEAREFAVRQEQLRSAGRLAAKIAHQIKNPLGIINNAAYSLQRSLQEGKPPNPQQLQIIREEIERADQTITQLMGYARLAEGRVEKLNVAEELDHAIEQAVPPAAKYPVFVEKDYASNLPALMMQRAHLSEIFVNLIQNAREALIGKGRIQVTARSGENGPVVVTIADDGPGIPKSRLDKIFQPYFTTKEKGTGLGLSIVKHNTELYGGTVRVESELGKGTKFIVEFPTRTLMNKPQA
jgi:signal transduction histidine kinase